MAPNIKPFFYDFGEMVKQYKKEISDYVNNKIQLLESV